MPCLLIPCLTEKRKSSFLSSLYLRIGKWGKASFTVQARLYRRSHASFLGFSSVIRKASVFS